MVSRTCSEPRARRERVTIRDASIVEDHVAVPYPKYKVKDAPSVDSDSGFQESGKAWARTQEQKGSRQS
jgi:hypothetical protein